LAVPGASVSLGEGTLLGGDETARSNVNVEAILTYSLVLVKLDLGVLFDMEQPDNPVWLRPGLRASLPGMSLYARGGLPCSMSEEFDWGILLGLGYELLDLKAVKVFAEVDATFMDSVSFKDVVPIEGRIGVSIGF
jgi:hypothetical protein